jgi:hypothetical protein
MSCIEYVNDDGVLYIETTVRNIICIIIHTPIELIYTKRYLHTFSYTKFLLIEWPYASNALVSE